MNMQVSAAFQMAFISRTLPFERSVLHCPSNDDIYSLLTSPDSKTGKKEKKNSNYFPVVHKDITAR